MVIRGVSGDLQVVVADIEDFYQVIVGWPQISGRGSNNGKKYQTYKSFILFISKEIFHTISTLATFLMMSTKALTDLLL